MFHLAFDGRSFLLGGLVAVLVRIVLIRLERWRVDRMLRDIMAASPPPPKVPDHDFLDDGFVRQLAQVEVDKYGPDMALARCQKYISALELAIERQRVQTVRAD